jgi:DNA-binding NtrC family response regulator
VDVALHGERGSGKEHFARHLHHLVDSDAPYTRIDCTEGELRIERALDALLRCPPTGGILFIDSLAVLPPQWQERLADGLLASRGGQGGNAFRVVVSQADRYAAGCRSGAVIPVLQRALTPVEIAIPALRTRRCDIPLLIEHFLGVYARQHGVTPGRLDRPALVALWQHDWPGNVRELESVLERLAVLGRGRVIGEGELPPNLMRDGRTNVGVDTPLPAPTSPGPSLRPLG